MAKAYYDSGCPMGPKAAKAGTAEFLRRVIAALPYKVHIIFTDNGPQSGNMPHQRWTRRLKTLRGLTPSPVHLRTAPN